MTLSRLLLLLLALCAAPLAAQPARHMQGELLAETLRPVGGGEVTLALRFVPQPGWHGYWRNPGEAGFAPQFSWTVPSAASVGEAEYPVPQTLVVGGLMNYVFEGEHALLFRLRLPDVPAGARVPVEVAAGYLVCTDEICVPEQARYSLVLVTGDGSGRDTRFDAWRSKLAAPLGAEGKFAREGDVLRLAIPFPAGAALLKPHFFPLAKGIVSDASEQRFERRGDELLLTTKAGDASTERLTGVLAIGNARGLQVTAARGMVSPAGDGPEALLFVLVFALGGAFLGGLILNVMPCVFPILSLKALSLAQGGTSEKAARREALAYTAGAVLTLVALGGLMLALKVGWAFQLQDPRVVLLLLMLTVALTLNLAGVFELPVIGGGVGAQGGFATGALAAFIATPCTGPFMGAALGAALVLPPLAGLAIFAGLGLGLAAPFLAVGFVPALRRRLPKPGKWMLTFRRVLAVPMALTAVWLGWVLWGQVYGYPVHYVIVPVVFITFAVIVIGFGQRRGIKLSPILPIMILLVIASSVYTLTLTPRVSKLSGPSRDDYFTEQRLNFYRKTNMPVFVYFTADWCLTCKVNEELAIEPSQQALERAGVVTLVGDWTNGDAAIGRFLREQGRAGVPLYLYYAPGAREPRVLPQVLTAGMIAGLAKG